MKAKDVLTEIQNALRETKKQGHSTVSIEAMENYLKEFDKEVDHDSHYEKLNFDSQIAQFKAENDRNIAHANNLTAHSVEMFKSVITAGQSALKASMVINGGAAVALLAFAGKIWETSTSALVATSLVTSTLIFCFGVLCAALASGITYLSQSSYSHDWIRTGHLFNAIGVISVLISYGLFGYGAYTASCSLGNHFGL